MTARSVHLSHILLLALYFAAAAAIYSRLPGHVPMHFGAGGEVTRWAGTSFWSWFALPLFAVAMMLFMIGLARLSRTVPDLWSIPEKERFLALAPAARARIQDRMERLVALCSILVTLMFASVHLGVYATAAGHSAGMPWQLLVVLAGLTLLLLAGAVWESNRVGGEILRLSEPVPDDAAKFLVRVPETGAET
jgi:hypothetical protein